VNISTSFSAILKSILDLKLRLYLVLPCHSTHSALQYAALASSLIPVYPFVTSFSMVRRWVLLFNEGRENVHDDPWSGQPSVVNDDLVRAVEEKIRENR